MQNLSALLGLQNAPHFSPAGNVGLQKGSMAACWPCPPAFQNRMEKLLTWSDIFTGGHLENQNLRAACTQVSRSIVALRNRRAESDGAQTRAVEVRQASFRPASHFSLYFYLQDQECWREKRRPGNNSFPVILGYLHLWSIFHTLFHKR